MLKQMCAEVQVTERFRITGEIRSGRSGRIELKVTARPFWAFFEIFLPVLSAT